VGGLEGNPNAPMQGIGIAHLEEIAMGEKLKRERFTVESKDRDGA